jgi:NADPH:quinone reductase-like Zn-dependent oxidoreductase
VTMTGGPGSPRAWYALAQAAGLIESGDFSLPVAQTFPLERIGEAQALSETGHVRGKLILLVS